MCIRDRPYTRQHEMTDIDDPRAASLLHLADLVEEAPPRFVCLENVVGFAASQSRDRWHGALRRAGFAQPKCWHLTPTQTGVPHERPRYFECAVRHEPCDWASPAPTEDAWPGLDEAPPMKRIAEFLEAPYALDQGADASALIEPYRVPAKTLKSDAAWCFDVVDATDDASVPGLLGSFLFLTTRHTFNKFRRDDGKILVPEFELYELLQHVRRRLATDAQARGQRDLERRTPRLV